MPTAYKIEMITGGFLPTLLKVRVEDSVWFSNRDTVVRGVAGKAANPGPGIPNDFGFETPNLAPGAPWGVWFHYFPTGKYYFSDRIYPQFKGEIDIVP
jgi:hypothetical protein